MRSDWLTGFIMTFTWMHTHATVPCKIKVPAPRGRGPFSFLWVDTYCFVARYTWLSSSALIVVSPGDLMRVSLITAHVCSPQSDLWPPPHSGQSSFPPSSSFGLMVRRHTSHEWEGAPEPTDSEGSDSSLQLLLKTFNVLNTKKMYQNQTLNDGHIFVAGCWWRSGGWKRGSQQEGRWRLGGNNELNVPPSDHAEAKVSLQCP